MVLKVNNLTVEYELQNSALRAVDSIDFTLEEGEILGIVGESGCGKTTAIKALLGLLDENGSIIDGEVIYKGTNISALSESQLRSEIRWKEISLIAQSAMAALDPVHTIGSQFSEVIRTHTEQSKAEARKQTKKLLKSVEIDPDRLDSYPHELSGGQRQRIIIALSMALNPSLIIADEPTTGLDVIVQDQILELMKDIQRDINCSMILVTHDMSVVAEVADQVAVMYGGRIMEIGPTSNVLKKSAHPYTIGLQNSFPSLKRNADMSELVRIPGTPPDLTAPPTGCRFKHRCPFSTERCDREEPPMHIYGPRHKSKCHYAEQADRMREDGKDATVWENQNEIDQKTKRLSQKDS